MRKLLLVGWRGADWSIIHPLMDRGELPNLQRLVDRGVSGPLSAHHPIVSAMLWTSMVTGKTADQHGILGPIEPSPVSGGARPSSSTSRSCKAIWNILEEHDRRAHVVNWAASHPAERLRGVTVSNAFCSAADSLPADAIHPPDLEATLTPFRLSPRDLSGTDLSLFVPEIARVDQQKDQRLIALARSVSESLTAHAVATWILERESWDFVAVNYDGLGQVAEKFLAYHPPQLPDVPDDDFAIYQGVVAGMYRMHDMMLGRLLDLAGADATVLLVSEHGYASGTDRPRKSEAVSISNPAMWQKRHGVFCMAGPGIRQDELVHGARVLDVTPTILLMFGLPVADDMPGRALLEVFDHTADVARIASWERDTDLHATGTSPTSNQSAADAIAQLAALGYQDAVPAEAERRRAAAARMQQLNLARTHLVNGHPAEALAILEPLLVESPDDLEVHFSVAEAHFRAGNLERSEGMAFVLLSEGHDRPLVRLLHANVAIQQGDRDRALKYLQALEATTAVDARLFSLMGHTYLTLNMLEDAERHFRRAVEAHPRSAPAWTGLATALLRQQRYRDAADAALEAVGYDYANSHAHYLLGVALCGGRFFRRAMTAFETCLRLEPRTVRAHRWLDRIHTHVTGDHERATFHRRQASDLTPPPRPDEVTHA